MDTDTQKVLSKWLVAYAFVAITFSFAYFFAPANNNQQTRVVVGPTEHTTALTFAPALDLDVSPEVAAQWYPSDSWEHSVLERIPMMRKKYGEAIRQVARERHIDPDFALMIMSIESNGDPKALSPTGAIGLMQLTTIARKDIDVHGDVWDPKTNIRMGITYLAKLRFDYGYRTKTSIAVAYNMGPTAVRSMRKGEIERHDYAQKLKFLMRYL